MQKLKKSIKDNLSKSYIKDSCFVLTDTSFKIPALNSEDCHISKSFIKTTISHVNLTPGLESVLKFPVKLKVFKSLYDLKTCLNQEKEGLKKSPPILVKANNLFFKDTTYEPFLHKDPQNQLLKLRRSIHSIIMLVSVLRLRLKLVRM